MLLQRSRREVEGSGKSVGEKNPSERTAKIEGDEQSLKYSLSPAGFGIRKLTPDKVPNPVAATTDPFTHMSDQSGLGVWNKEWNQWAKANRATWKGSEPIQTPDGPIQISGKTEMEMGRVAPKEDARLHYIAATKLSELLKNSVLKSVETEKKGKVGVGEVHRRYAWMDFPDGKRHGVLLTVFRWEEGRNRDYDTAYSQQVYLQVLPATNSANGTLASFLSGMKQEHKLLGE